MLAPGRPREAGPAAILVLVVVLAVLWAALHPAGEAWGSFVGQLVGAESVLLLSVALVLISTLPWVEEWFDGIDRAAIWHRRVSIAGLALLLPHLLLASGEEGAGGEGGGIGGPLGAIGVIGLVALVAWAILPRWPSVVPGPLRPLIKGSKDLPVVREVRKLFGGYERWRLLHRTVGLFVAAGFLHAVLDGTPWDAAPALRWVTIASGGVGLAFYVYRELLARFFLSLHDYQVQEVRPLEQGLTELVLRPLGRHMAFVPGQFAMVYLEAKDGWHRHPFTIASAPHEGVVRVTVKALGDYTSRLRELVEPGMPAVIGGPHGRFHHAKGGPRQVWIAGGVGIAPFLSWLRALDGSFGARVHLFYSAEGAAPFADELLAIAARHPTLAVHLVDTAVDGRLTPEQVLAAASGDGAGEGPGAARELSVFMCGPEGMLRSFQQGLREAGVPARAIHREFFDWR